MIANKKKTRTVWGLVPCCYHCNKYFPERQTNLDLKYCRKQRCQKKALKELQSLVNCRKEAKDYITANERCIEEEKNKNSKYSPGRINKCRAAIVAWNVEIIKINSLVENLQQNIGNLYKVLKKFV